MASPAAIPTCRQRRGPPRAQLPHSYHEGYLEKRSAEDKVPRRLWTCLCGKTLFFFNNSKDTNYVEKLDLSGFVSLMDDNSRDQNPGAAQLSLRLKDREIKLIIPTPEARELWKGFIHAVTELSVPSSLKLLPGQLYVLREVVEKEKERHKLLTVTQEAANTQEPVDNIYLSLLGDMPSCYRKVSRTEAMMLLQRHSACGNLLLRPGSDDSWLAITTYQYLNEPMFKHYRVFRKQEGGFSIDLKTPVPCATLHDVVHYLVQETGGALKPFTSQETYEDCITFMQLNSENGERTLMCTVDGSAKVPVRPPKPAPQESSPSPELEWDTDANFYLNHNCKSEENSSKSSHSNTPLQPPTPPPKPVKKTEVPPQGCLPTSHHSEGEYKEEGCLKSSSSSAVHPPIPPPKPGTEKVPEKVALMPPLHAPRATISQSSPSGAKPFAVKIFTSANPKLKELSEELKEIVGKRFVNQL